MARKKLVPLSEFQLTWSEEDYDHEKATKFIHSLLGQIENLETKNDEVVTERDAALADAKSAERKLSKAQEGDSEAVAELKTQNEKLQADLDGYDVTKHPDYIKLEVSHSLGLDTFAAKRLAGKTREEIEADAKEWVEQGYVKGSEGGDAEEERLNPGGGPVPKRGPRAGDSDPGSSTSDRATKSDWDRLVELGAYDSNPLPGTH